MKAEFYHTFRIPEKGINITGQWDLNPTIEHFKFDVKGKTLLDVACRDGFYSYHFEKQGAIVTGLDMDDRTARRYIHKAIGSGVKFLHRNAYSIKDLPEKSFDIVFAGDVVCHVEDPLRFLKQMHHAAKEKFYLVADAWPAPGIWWEGYIWKFTEADMLLLLKFAGFRNIKVLARYKIGSDFWPKNELNPRSVVLYECDRDQDWKYPNETSTIARNNTVYRPEIAPEIDFKDDEVTP